jgi:hypothetical protein
MTRPTTTEAIHLMRRFAERTDVSGSSDGRRYLWTDAFAVCNFLGLAAAAGDAGFADLARRLVARVHHTLGRHRPDDARTGWLAGASEAHPTRGGLRIGKPLPERRPGEPMDERLEWDRDGQYFHYLTKWMHALDRMARTTGEPVFHLWASELAAAAHRAFVHAAPGGGRYRMYWKMSIDLSRPLVPSMGQHDPLDGWITCVQLATRSAASPPAPDAPDLGAAADDFRAMVVGADVATADPLGLGGLLADACRVAQLMRAGAFAGSRLLEGLLAAAARGLDAYAYGREWRLPVERRLAFRELGLVIGLAGVEWLRGWDGLDASAAGVGALLDGLARHAPLGHEILDCWREPAHRTALGWSQHEDINDVMLATSLAPEGFLVLGGSGPRGPAVSREGSSG